MKEEITRLNPFVYISETNIRFYLLILISILLPSSFAFTYGAIILSLLGNLQITIILRILLIVPTFSIIPLFIYWNYKRFPKKIIKKSKMIEFDKKSYPKHWDCIEKLYRKYLFFSNIKKPTLKYQPMDPTASAFTFGTKDHKYIGMSGGLIIKFLKNIEDFKSIFLHELAHLANKDIEKAYLATSAWRSLILTIPIPFIYYYLSFSIPLFYYGILEGYDIGYLILDFLNLIGEDLFGLGIVILYFLLFVVIIYVLRNQIIQLREFYADAKVAEWKESPKELIKTLKEGIGKQYSKFEILTKFHPNTNERIQVLKNNSRLFIPSLWVAFAAGFFYAHIYTELVSIYQMIFSDFYWESLSLGIEYQIPTDIIPIVFISTFIFTILMLAVSSSFHKSILKDVFMDNKEYFSTSTMLNVIKFSMIFSLGIQTSALIHIPLKSFSLYENALGWIVNVLCFAITLAYLLIFALMLIRRSFSKREAYKNFLIITVFSSILFIVNRYVAIKIFHNYLLMIVFFLIFSTITFIFIKLKDRKLSCPDCNNKISNLPGVKLNCPNCHHSLYSWAIYSPIDRQIASEDTREIFEKREEEKEFNGISQIPRTKKDKIKLKRIGIFVLFLVIVMGIVSGIYFWPTLTNENIYSPIYDDYAFDQWFIETNESLTNDINMVATAAFSFDLDSLEICFDILVNDTDRFLDEIKTYKVSQKWKLIQNEFIYALLDYYSAGLYGGLGAKYDDVNDINMATDFLNQGNDHITTCTSLINDLKN